MSANPARGLVVDDVSRPPKPPLSFDAGRARQQGGTIEAASEPGQGSTFTRRSPLREQS